MKYEHQRELVEGLRAMADFIEANIELPVEFEPEVKLNVWLYNDSRYNQDIQIRVQRERSWQSPRRFSVRPRSATFLPTSIWSRSSASA